MGHLDAMLAATLSVFVVAQAHAASVADLSGALTGNFVDLTTAANKNLSDDGAYASNVPTVAYLFGEGEYVGGTNPTTTQLGIDGQQIQSFLLHFDPGPNSPQGAIASGAFDILLAPGETYKGFVGRSIATGTVVDNLVASLALDATDPSIPGVVYPKAACVPNALCLRGAEGFGFDQFSQDTSIANVVHVQFGFRDDGISNHVDEMRFFVQSADANGGGGGATVPEPPTGVMMLGGFAWLGAAMRRMVKPSRRSVPAGIAGRHTSDRKHW